MKTTTPSQASISPAKRLIERQREGSLTSVTQNGKRILIVDDEELARQRIHRYLKQSEQEFVIREAESGIEAVDLIPTFQPELIFLDVEMPGLSGFEALKQLPERTFQIIFQTAFDEFAVRAFEEQACDYLLKPFTRERFEQALSNALGRIEGEEKLKALEAKMAEREGYLRRIVVKQGARLRIVEEQAVSCFVSRDHYTCVYFDGQREGITELSLSHLLDRLDPQVFRQFHRNNIIRLEALVALSRSRNGSMEAELSNGLRLPVSRSNRRLARELIKTVVGGQ
jgi:two-component system, LytTR family, response regulator